MLKPVLMLKIHTFCLMVFLLSTTLLTAQDPSFSQFYAAKAYLNPALAAYEQGVTVNTSYRRQWSSIPNSYQTLLLSTEWREKNWGFGVLAGQDTEGVGRLTTTELSVVANRQFICSDKSIFMLGVQMSPFLRREMNTQNLIFSDQLDPILGVVLPIQQPLDNLRSTAMDISFGSAFRTTLKTIFKKDFRLMGGFSVHRLMKPRESVLGVQMQLTPIRMAGHLGLEVPIIGYGRAHREKWLYWMPTIRYDLQKRMDLMTIGSFFIFDNDFFFGAFYQNNFNKEVKKNTDAFVLQIGYQIALTKDKTLQMSFSYDANRGGIGNGSGGVYEVHTTFNFGDTQFSKKGRKPGMPSNSKCFLF